MALVELHLICTKLPGQDVWNALTHTDVLGVHDVRHELRPGSGTGTQVPTWMCGKNESAKGRCLMHFWKKYFIVASPLGGSVGQYTPQSTAKRLRPPAAITILGYRCVSFNAYV